MASPSRRRAADPAQPLLSASPGAADGRAAARSRRGRADARRTGRTIDPVVVDRLAAYGHAPEEVVARRPEPGRRSREVESSSDPTRVARRRDEPRRRARRFGSARLRAASKQRAPKERKDKRSKKLVGLKIGASQIAAAQVVNNGAPELVEAFREPLEPGLVVSGEIRDPDALGDALKRFFELHKLPKRGVRLGLSNNRIGVRIFEIEGVADAQQLENAIRFRAEEVLPIPLDEAVLDYVVLDEQDARGRHRRGSASCSSSRTARSSTAICRRAGGRARRWSASTSRRSRSFARSRRRPSATRPPARSSPSRSATTGRRSRSRPDVHCEFARVLDWGGWSLNVAIARELDRAPSEVESIKRQLSFAHATEVDGLTPEQVAKTRDGIQRALATFARELVASLQFYQAQPGALGIGEIVLTGRHRAHGRLRRGGRRGRSASRFASAIRSGASRSGRTSPTTASTARSRSRSGSGSRTDARRQPASARRRARSAPTAVALPAPRRGRRYRRRDRGRGSAVHGRLRLGLRPALAARVRRGGDRAHSDRSSGRPSRPSTIAQERTDRVTALAAALTTRVPVDRLLRELAYVLPEDAWLTGLTASAATGSRRAPVAGSAAPGTPSAAPGRHDPGRDVLARSRSRACSRDSPRCRRSTTCGSRASARVEPAGPTGDATKSKQAKKQKAVVTFTHHAPTSAREAPA